MEVANRLDVNQELFGKETGHSGYVEVVSLALVLFFKYEASFSYG